MFPVKWPKVLIGLLQGNPLWMDQFHRKHQDLTSWAEESLGPGLHQFHESFAFSTFAEGFARLGQRFEGVWREEGIQMTKWGHSIDKRSCHSWTFKEGVHQVDVLHKVGIFSSEHAQRLVLHLQGVFFNLFSVNLNGSTNVVLKPQYLLISDQCVINDRDRSDRCADQWLVCWSVSVWSVSDQWVCDQCVISVFCWPCWSVYFADQWSSIILSLMRLTVS